MYTLIYDSRIEKDLRSIPKSHLGLILRRIEQLAAEPRCHGVEKLSGIDGYRLTAADYRILFTIDDSAKRVTVYRIRHRREAYR